jgi:hypothetical protein
MVPETVRVQRLQQLARKSSNSLLRLARENKRWGFRRIVGALSNLGHQVSHQTMGNILKRHGLGPAPEREKTTTWREFIRSHLEVVVAADFFTVEVWTSAGLMTYYVLVSCGWPLGRFARWHHDLSGHTLDATNGAQRQPCGGGLSFRVPVFAP